MLKRSSLELTSKGGDSASFQLELSDTEWTLVEDYADKADHLAELPLVRRGLWATCAF